MANTQAMCTSFKVEALCGIHALGTTVARGSTAADTVKSALYLASATINAATTAYSSTGEVTGTNYTAGGITITNANAPASSGTTAYWTPSANLAFGSAGSPVTLATAFDCALIYNSTQGNKAISVHTFGSTTINAGIFTLTRRAHDASNALLRIA